MARKGRCNFFFFCLSYRPISDDIRYADNNKQNNVLLKHSQECTLRNVTKFGDHIRRALSIKVYSTFVENFKQTIYLLNAKKIYDQ